MSTTEPNDFVTEAINIIPQNGLKRYNIVVQGRRTSVTLEPHTWKILNDVCKDEAIATAELFDMIAANKGKISSMSSAIRVFLMAYLHAKNGGDLSLEDITKQAMASQQGTAAPTMDDGLIHF